jgi:hypothetical protein
MNKKKIQLGELSEVAKLGADGGWTLVFVRALRHPPERVWEALTDPSQMREWAPLTANRNLGTTGPAIVSMIDGEVSVSDRLYIGQCGAGRCRPVHSRPI